MNERTLRRSRSAWVFLVAGSSLALAAPGCSDSDTPAATGGTGGTAGEPGHAGQGDSGGAGADTSGTGGTTSAGGTTSGGGTRPGTGGTRPDVGGAGGESGGEAGADAGGSGSTSNCGDGSVDGREACDDGNTNAGDGCYLCSVDTGWACGTSAPSTCRPRVVSISASGLHTCAALSTGDVVCFGHGSHSQTGYVDWHSIGDDEVPASMGTVDVGAPVSAVSAGVTGTCALLVSGAVRCWGSNYYGQLGRGNTEETSHLEPPSAAGEVDVGGAVEQLVNGELHACALLTTGGVRCWGYAYSGQLGYGNFDNIGDDEMPATAGDVPIGERVVALSAGMWHTCALLTTGNVRCWGYASDGQLGYGNTDGVGDDETPASVGDVPLGGRAVQISAGSFHTCALLTTGNVRCWGLGQSGILGYGNVENIGDDETPASVGDVPLGVRVDRIAAGARHTCVRTTARNVRCWGQAYFGQIGYADSSAIGNDELPSSVGDVDLGGPVDLLTTGGDHNCVVLASRGSVRCWGRGEEGQLGYGNPNNIGDDETPASAGDVDYFRVRPRL